MVTRKPIRGLAGAPYIVENDIDIEEITRPLKIFDGTAREAAKGFPANVNVAIALSLAGIGPDLTRIEIGQIPPDAQHASHRGRFRFCQVFHVDRKYPVRKPKDGSDHRLIGSRLSSQTACLCSCWNLNRRSLHKYMQLSSSLGKVHFWRLFRARRTSYVMSIRLAGWGGRHSALHFRNLLVAKSGCSASASPNSERRSDFANGGGC